MSRVIAYSHCIAVASFSRGKPMKSNSPEMNVAHHHMIYPLLDGMAAPMYVYHDSDNDSVGVFSFTSDDVIA